MIKAIREKNGDPGQNGADGYTPVKGVDYFTQADIEEIRQGMQEEITSENMLPSDLVNDTNQTNKFVTSTEKTTWNNKADVSDIPTDTSDLNNDSGFITNTVNDLLNYYKKNETFTKQEVNDLISAITTLDLQVVQTLPTEDISTTTIYLVPKTIAQTNNAYDEYIYISNNWEFIGSTEVDLTNYVTNTDYATDSKAGVIKTDGDYGFSVNASGKLYSTTKTYSQYEASGNGIGISKGTLENVLAEKIGNIETILETLDVGGGLSE